MTEYHEGEKVKVVAHEPSYMSTYGQLVYINPELESIGERRLERGDVGTVWYVNGSNVVVEFPDINMQLTVHADSLEKVLETKYDAGFTKVRTVTVSCLCGQHYSKVALRAEDGPEQIAYFAKRSAEAADMACSMA